MPSLTENLQSESSTHSSEKMTHSFNGVCAVKKISASQIKVVDKTANFTFYYKLRDFLDIVSISFDVEKAKRVGTLLGEGENIIVDFMGKKILRVKTKPESMIETFIRDGFSKDRIDDYLGSSPAASFKNPQGAFWQNR